MKSKTLGLALLLVIALAGTHAVSAAQKRVAVLGIHVAGKAIPDAEAAYLTNLIRTTTRDALPVSRYLVMTEESIEALLSPEEQERWRHCTTDLCEVEVGRRLNADYVVSGEIFRIDSELRLTLKLHDTASANLLKAVNIPGTKVLDMDVPIADQAQGLFAALSGFSGRRPRPGGTEGPIGETGKAWTATDEAEVIVSFESEPGEATVELGDQPICETPCSRALNPGVYDVAMKKVKWITERSTVKIEAGMDPVSWTLEPDFGWLTVKSEPAGLDVSINGKVEGKTPITKREMPPGRYEVLVTDLRYFDQGKRVGIQRGEDEVVDVVLEPRQGGIKVEAVDRGGNAVEGDVYLDGAKAGRTYRPITVLIGRHEVEVSSGCGGWAGTVEVFERETVLVEARLTEGGVIRPQGSQRGSSRQGGKMVEIPAGRFMMGSPESEEGRFGDERQHEVVISRPFLAAKYEVTQALWKAIMGSNPSMFDSCGDDCPVENLTWNEAVEFCNRLSEQEGLAPAYQVSGKGVVWDRSANGYRLPTEAEWEYACRAGTATSFHSGRCLHTDEANYNGNFSQEGCAKGRYREKTVAVGGFSANTWGLHDMLGNVGEWCWDWHGDYPKGPVTDPTGPSGGSFRVFRGGSWLSNARYCRSANRSMFSPGYRNDYVGFRLFRSI